MKDALGHGSNPHGIHSQGIDKIGGLPANMSKLVEANRDKIHSAFIEKDPGSPPSYWILLKPGWTCTDMECGTIHEDRVSDLAKRFKSVKREV